MLKRSMANLPEKLRRVEGSRAYVPELDGLRFFAIMPVLVWHASIRGYRSWLELSGLPPLGEPGWLPHGQVGVSLFFVISGFVIARPFLRAIDEKRSLQVGRFYIRRLLRLQPPYLLVLAVCALIAAGGVPKGGHNLARELHHAVAPWNGFLASAFYAHVPVFGGPSLLNPPMWSLEVEIQFYLISPLLVWLYAGVRQVEWRLASGIYSVALALVVSAAIRSWAGNFSIWHFTLATHLSGFLLGVVMADLHQLRPRRGEAAAKFKDFGFVVGIALLLLSGLWEFVTAFWPMLLRDTLRLVACAMIVEGALSGARAKAWSGAPWIALIGSACYSIYLLHVPLMVAVWLLLSHWVAIPAALCIPLAIAFLPLVSIVGGLAFYALIERPFMKPDWPRTFAGFLASALGSLTIRSEKL
jgi:peptidoglycan/LPS O-acetylase OafA/YrhL